MNKIWSVSLFYQVFGKTSKWNYTMDYILNQHLQSFAAEQTLKSLCLKIRKNILVEGVPKISIQDIPKQQLQWGKKKNSTRFDSFQKWKVIDRSWVKYLSLIFLLPKPSIVSTFRSSKNTRGFFFSISVSNSRLFQQRDFTIFNEEEEEKREREGRYKKIPAVQQN